jgi:hypothetical protein
MVRPISNAGSPSIWQGNVEDNSCHWDDHGLRAWCICQPMDPVFSNGCFIHLNVYSCKFKHLSTNSHGHVKSVYQFSVWCLPFPTITCGIWKFVALECYWSSVNLRLRTSWSRSWKRRDPAFAAPDKDVLVFGLHMFTLFGEKVSICVNDNNEKQYCQPAHCKLLQPMAASDKIENAQVIAIPSWGNLSLWSSLVPKYSVWNTQRTISNRH